MESLDELASLIDALPAVSRALTIDDRTYFTYCSAYFHTVDR